MRRASRFSLGLSAAVIGVLLAAMAGIAAAASFTLGVNKSTVTNFNTHQSTTGVRIVTAAGGFAVYTLTGDSRSHPQCLSQGCKAIWPWVTIGKGKTPTKNPVIKAKLGVWQHKNGVRQLTLGGHPLYFYAGDNKKLRANGEAIRSFGGVWQVWKVTSTSSSTSTMPTPTPTPMPTPTPTPPPNPYPY